MKQKETSLFETIRGHLEKDVVIGKDINKTWSFNIKYKLTEPNINIHEEFCNFSKQFSDDNYLQAISLLLRGWKQDVAVAMSFDEIMENRRRISELKDAIESSSIEEEEEKEDNEVKTLGGN